MLVSAVITAYNAEKYIDATLQSVRAQTYSPLEIIVVDDGSADGTADIVKGRFPDVQYIYQRNAGQPAARNAGIRHARGQFIAFVDSDDLWFPQKIARQIAWLDEHPAVWCYCDCLYFREDPQHSLYRYSAQVHPRSGRILESLLLGNFISSPTPMIRRDVLIEIGLWDESVAIGEDWNMWLKIAARYPIEYVDGALAAYRVHSDNMTTGSSVTNILESNLSVLARGLAHLPGHSHRFAEKARANIFFKVGLIYLKRGQEASGRRMIFRALRNDPLQPRFYAYQLASLMPPALVKAMNILRRRYFQVIKPTQ